MPLKFNPLTGMFDIVGASGGGGVGDVTGPASSTDNAVARYDGATGKVIQNSNVTISDTGEMTLTTDSVVVNNSLYLPENVYLVTGTDVTNKFLTLSRTPKQPTKVRVCFVGGIPQEYGVDFSVSGNTIVWNGLALDGFIANGDKLLIDYN